MGIIINSRPTLKSGPVSKVVCRVNSANSVRSMCLKVHALGKTLVVLALYKSVET